MASRCCGDESGAGSPAHNIGFVGVAPACDIIEDMNEALTDDELDAIWDDESETPPPMTAAQMDERLEAHTAALREERLAFGAQTATLRDVIAQYETVARELREEARHSSAQRSPETIHLRDNLLRLAKRSLSVAQSL